LLRDSFRRFTITPQYSNLCRERAKERRNSERAHRVERSVASLKDLLNEYNSKWIL